MKSKLLVVGVLAVIFGISLAATQNADALGVSLRVAGSSVPSRLISKWNMDFGSATNGVVSANYVTQQTGIAKTTFISNAADFAVVDVPLTTAEKTTVEQTRGSSVAHAPLAVTGIALSYNSASLGLTTSNPLKLTSKIIADIFSGSITLWNDSAIVGLNPSLANSTQTIKPIIFDGQAGTTYIMTRYLLLEGHWTQSPSFTITGGNNAIHVTSATAVTDAISSTAGAIGYLPYGDALDTDLQTAAVLNKNEQYVQPSTTAFAAAASSVDGSLPLGTDVWTDSILLSTESSTGNSYPISFFVFALFNVDQAPAGASGAAVGAYLTYVQTTIAQNKATEYGFAGLNAAAITNNNNTLNTLTYASGTATTDYYPYRAPTAPVITAPIPVAPPTLIRISSSALQIIIIIILVVLIALVVAFDQYRGGCIIHFRSTGRGVWA